MLADVSPAESLPPLQHVHPGHGSPGVNGWLARVAADACAWAGSGAASATRGSRFVKHAQHDNMHNTQGLQPVSDERVIRASHAWEGYELKGGRGAGPIAEGVVRSMRDHEGRDVRRATHQMSKHHASQHQMSQQSGTSQSISLEHASSAIRGVVDSGDGDALAMSPTGGGSGDICTSFDTGARSDAPGSGAPHRRTERGGVRGPRFNAVLGGCYMRACMRRKRQGGEQAGDAWYGGASVVNGPAGASQESQNLDRSYSRSSSVLLRSSKPVGKRQPCTDRHVSATSMPLQLSSERHVSASGGENFSSRKPAEVIVPGALFRGSARVASQCSLRGIPGTFRRRSAETSLRT